MYIRKTETRVINGIDHFTNRMVESRRDVKCKVKQHTLLNLGAHYDLIPEVDNSILAQRVDNIITGQLSLLPHSKELETEAQRIANMIIKKHADNKKIYVRYEHVDIASIENTDVKTIGVEYLAYEAAIKISLPEILLKCGFSEKEVDGALASVISRLISPGSEGSMANYLRNNSALPKLVRNKIKR